MYTYIFVVWSDLRAQAWSRVFFAIHRPVIREYISSIYVKSNELYIAIRTYLTFVTI